VRLTSAIDAYVADQFAIGRFNSDATERGYRRTLAAHAEDVNNRELYMNPEFRAAAKAVA
jgi:hypothetical protein